MKKYLVSLLGLCGLLALVGCGGGAATPPPPSLAITSAAPPAGTTGSTYAGAGFALTASGGNPPYNWNWAPAAGSALPPGLKLASGIISGTPTKAGTYQVTVTVADSQSPAALTTAPPYTINISDPPTLTITSGTPPGGMVGLVYSSNKNCGIPCPITGGVPLTATGGVPPYSWNWVGANGSSTPPGLGIRGGSARNCDANAPDYEICGVPTTAGTYDVVVTVTDFASPPNQASTPYSIKIVNPPPPVIHVVPLPVGGINLPYSFTFSIKMTFNHLALTWSETGALPPGLNLASSGVLSGTPTAVGSFPITVTVTDAVGQSSLPVDFTVEVDAHGFKTTGSMATPRASHTATLLQDGRVLVAGGTSTLRDTNTAEIYDPVSGTFSPANNMSDLRSGHTATMLKNGKVLIAGGGTNTAELYDPNSGNFVATGSMSTARALHTATLLQDGRVLIAGGQQTNGVLMTAEIFDPASGAFTLTGNMTTTRSQFTATLLSSGAVLLTGGIDNTDTGLKSAELFDPATGHFSATGAMTAGRAGQTASLLHDNTVVVMGGTDPSSNTRAVAAEIYDMATGSFSTSGNLAQGVFDHTATLLPNGQVLVAGGIFQVGVFTAELYDPLSLTFTETGSLITPRYDHTATLLSNGTVLVVGGRPDGGTVLNTAELYQ